jgi:rubredoxin-NAD+ reductase
MTQPIIIIGAGLAGWSTAREFRKRDASTPLLLITADSGDFYAKPSLSNAFAQGRSPAQLVSTPAASMRATQNVTLLAHTRVQAIHPGSRTISTSQGEFSYSQLVLATGAQPIRVPVVGNAADQVLSINSLADFSAFHARLTQACSDVQPAKQVLIMGAGLIGCEFANDLVASGYRVTVVDPAPSPIAALLPPQASGQLRAALAALGVVWHFGATVKSVDLAPEAPPPTLQVELSNGQKILADLVLSAIGLRADTTLAQAAGLACERGIVVDASLQTSQPHIYALGDSAQYATGSWDAGAGVLAPDTPAVSGGRTLPYVMPIMNAARALAATLAGARTELAFPLMPVLVKTPALPLVVAAPAPGTPGDWHSVEPGIWQFIDAQAQVRGFVLSGPQTSHRTEQAKQVRA